MLVYIVYIRLYVFLDIEYILRLAQLYLSR